MGENVDKAKGRAKKATGELTGNKSLKDEGRVDKATGKVKAGASKAGEKAKKGIRRSQ